MRTVFTAALAACLSLSAPAVLAADKHMGHDHHGHHNHQGHRGHHAPRPDAVAPTGVMGSHLHHKGGVMFSYRYMRMDMAGNQLGSSNIAPTTIATTIPNRFFGMPGQPPTLRVVPTDMVMEMHMFGAMYAPSDSITLMAMVPYVRKTMNHLTFAGPAGPAVLGGFQTKTEGLGDVKLSTLIGLWQGQNGSLHLNLGASLPTGSTTETGRILAPTGATPLVRLPYAMQLGSGTVDVLPGLTYAGRKGNLGYGAQLSAVIRTGKNRQGYALGNEYKATAWASYQPTDWMSLSGRVEAKNVGRIRGIDPAIMGPVQTANPLNYGGETVTLYAGVNMIAKKGALRGHRFAIEAGVPVHQDLNGVQMETDWTLNLGWQKAF